MTTISATTRIPLPRPRVRGLDDDPAPGDKPVVCKAPDPAMEPFARAEHARRDELAARLQGDRQVRAMMDRWPELTMKEKLALGRRASALMGDVYGFTPAPMRLMTAKQADGSDGHYDEEIGPLGTIELNVAKMRGRGPAVMVAFLDTVLHEQTHRYQTELVQRLEAGRIPRTDPAWPVVKALAANEKHYHEASDDKKKQHRYRCQISERQAWNNGTGIVARLMKLRTLRFEAMA